MSGAVKKTIPLSPDLARPAEQMTQAHGKTLSGVVQDARHARTIRLRTELVALQAYWTQKAKERGGLTEEDLDRYLQA